MRIKNIISKTFYYLVLPFSSIFLLVNYLLSPWGPNVTTIMPTNNLTSNDNINININIRDNTITNSSNHRLTSSTGLTNRDDVSVNTNVNVITEGDLNEYNGDIVVHEFSHKKSPIEGLSEYGQKIYQTYIENQEKKQKEMLIKAHKVQNQILSAKKSRVAQIRKEINSRGVAGDLGELDELNGGD
ncbi:MAG: hypothetical protein HQK51_06930 [Oligoflexia bacterium]|nr:hypothetical protein [Oligoflexia bacterium]